MTNIALTHKEERQISETMDEIQRALRRGNVEGRPVSAFDEGFKIFVRPSNNLSPIVFEAVQQRLRELGIHSCFCVDGAQGASWITPCFVVWKFSVWKGDTNDTEF